jgi:hypothetical protein
MRMNGNYYLTGTTDLQAIVDFFDNLYIASNTTSTVHVYYPNSPITANGQVQTVATYPDLEFSTVFTPDSVSSVYIDTYLSTIRMHATGDLVDFSDVVLNDYIASRMGSSVILDGKNTLRKGFIPFIDSVTTTIGNVAVPKTTINQSGDATIITAMAEGSSQYTSDPAFQEGPRTHGSLFTKNSAYQPIVNMLRPLNVSDTSTPITMTGAAAPYVEISPTLPLLTGHWSLANRCKGTNASCPSIIPLMNITKA